MMKKQMKRVMKTAISLLLVAMMLCLCIVEAFATTVQESSDIHSLDDHLVLYSSFDDSNANDESGNGHHGTAVGNVQYADGVDGKAVHITGQTNDGSDGGVAASIYVNYGPSKNILSGTDDFTISVYFRATGKVPTWSAVLGAKNYLRGKNKGFVLVAQDGNEGRQRLNMSDGSNNVNIYSNVDILNGAWHHLTATFDRDGLMVYYVDGVVAGTYDISAYPETMEAGCNLMLGADGNGHYGADNCLLDEVRIYNKALTKNEVVELHNDITPDQVVAEREIIKMLKAVSALMPNALYPQEKIDEMLVMLNGALDQLATLNNEQCLALMANCQAAYDRFLNGLAPLASFHWISDVHVPYFNDGYAKALQNMASINAASNIGLVITGDITNNGSAAQFETFYALTKENSPVSAANTAIILGNHDVRIGSSPSTPDQYDPSTSYWATAKGLYLQHNAEYMPSTDTVYHVKKLGGYTFIMLNTEMDLRDASYMSSAQLAWLEETLAAAYAEDPTKPIFIAHHQPLYDTHNTSNAQRTFLMEGMTEEESNNKIKEVLAKYPTSIFMSGHLHNGYSSIRGIVRPFGAAVEIPAFDDGGNSYEVQIYSDCVVFRAINYVTGEYLPAYDMTIQIGENNVSQIYQDAQKVLADADQYDATAIDNIRALSNTLHGLITVSYTSGMDNFYKAAQHAEINTAAQNLKNALNALSVKVSAGDTVTVVAGEALQLAADGATGWSSGNESIFTVDASGKLTALKSGTATLTVTTASGEFTCNVTVKVNTSALDDAIYAANTLKTNVAVADTVCGAGVGKVYVSTAAMQDLTDAVSAAQTALADATTEAEVASAAKALNDALDAFRAVIKVAVAHEGELACSVKCKYGCGTNVAHVACVGEIACQDNACKYCGKVVTPLAHKGEFECSNICQYGCGTTVEAKQHEGEDSDSVMCKYGCGTLVGVPTASMTVDGVTTYYASLEEAVAAATSGSTVTLLRDIGSEDEPLALTDVWLTIPGNTSTVITLDGNGHIITATSTASGSTASMIKARDRSGFTLKNITIRLTLPENANNETPILGIGGKINVTLENCKLYTNKSGVVGINQRRSVTMINTEIHAGYNAYMSHDNANGAGGNTFTTTFTNCKLYSTGAQAIQARIDDTLILNDTVVQGDGVDIDCSYGSYANAVQVNGNTVFTNGNIAIKAPTSVAFGTADAPFTGKQIIRESGNNYYFYGTLAAAFEAGATKEELCTYSKETADAMAAEGYFVITNGTRYTIGEPGATLTVGDVTTPYATLLDAIAAANAGNGGTIKLMADAVFESQGTIEIGKSITIDGQGEYKITGSAASDLFQPKANGVVFTLKDLKMNITFPAVNCNIVYTRDTDATIIIDTCNLTSSRRIAQMRNGSAAGSLTIKDSYLYGGAQEVIYWRSSNYGLNITGSYLEGKTRGIGITGAPSISIADTTVTSSVSRGSQYMSYVVEAVVHISGAATLTLGKNVIIDSTLIETVDNSLVGADYGIYLVAGSTLNLEENAYVKGKIAGILGADSTAAVNFGTTNAAYTGAQIIRKSGNDYSFYDFDSDLELQVGDFTYSAATVDAIKAQYYTVSEASGVYTVTGKIDVSPLVNAISAAENTKANVVSAEKACMAGAGNRYVTPAQMDALNAAIATAKAKLAAICSADQVTAAVNELNPVVAAFEDAIETGIAHEGEKACSTTCQWCGTTITGAAHVGQYDCSVTCKECGATIAQKADHVGEHDCSTTCKWCSTTIAQKADHVGEHDCSTICKWCSTTIAQKSAHVGEKDCSTTCKWCGTAITVKSAHVGEKDCSTSCKWCGTAITAKSAHVGEHDCSTTCKECGTAIAQKADHIGEKACSTTCKWCGTAITAKSAHVGEHDCSTTCKECGTAIAQKADHIGEKVCSTTCKWCGTTITGAAHEGEFECSTTCKYGCGIEITDAKTCVGAVACVDTTCQWCGEAVTPIAHDMVTDAAKAPTCTETGLTEGSHCSRCDTATTAQQTVAAAGHKYDNDSDATCNVCGAERAVENQTNGNENTANGSENNAQNGNTEAPAKQGLSGGAVAGIVIGVVAVLGGGGFALFWFVIRKKKI